MSAYEGEHMIFGLLGQAKEAHICNPTIQEAEGPWVRNQPGLYCETQSEKKKNPNQTKPLPHPKNFTTDRWHQQIGRYSLLTCCPLSLGCCAPTRVTSSQWSGVCLNIYLSRDSPCHTWRSNSSEVTTPPPDSPVVSVFSTLLEFLLKYLLTQIL
jgi:hypothetical protein